MDCLRIRLAKEAFKFSSTHFTLMGGSHAERLHGHNYQIAVECEMSAVGSLGMGFEFNTLKPEIRRLAQQWDERVLIPRQCPELKVSAEVIYGTDHWNLDFVNLQRSYRFPKEDVVFLESVNITSEELARLFATNLSRNWQKLSLNDAELASRVQSLIVTIEETRGQSAAYLLSSPLLRTDFA